MTTIGFIGSGRIGGTLARLAVDAGHDVVLSNNSGPDSLRDLVAALGPRARAATPDEAATAGEIVVVTIPIRAYRQIPAAALRGKTVIDTLNYDPARQGHVAEIDAAGTPAELLLQRHLTGSHVVKAFSTVFFAHLATLGRPAGAADRSALPIAGDDADAKKAVTALIDSLGYDAYDAGPLAESRRFAPGTPAQLAHLDPDGMFAAPGRPVSPERLATLLESWNTGVERRLVETLYRAIGGEPDLLDDVLAPDWEDIPSIPGQPLGPAGMKPHIADFHRAFADARVIIHDIVAVPGMVAVRGALAGTLRAEFLGVPPNNRYDEITIHEFHQIENGRIRRSWHLEDLHGWKSRNAL
ncbi:ester cyclase [Catenuloplanes japonicus]|uniref:ester cyclase n=1 Tax=Catenuloplanes japonicus TaxID=33876 RepID=UPI000A104629|nr:ester cyclase [Catenuloplanes japonicus]